MSEDRRRELAHFLRSRRARLTPADVGLPAGPRRRTDGLRREEVAVLAGLSPTWYTYLEQARNIHPSPEVLNSLARVLALTEDERRYLHALANDTASTPQPLVADPAARELVGQLVQTTLDSPYPAYGIDLYCDLIAWNRAATTYYADFGRLPEQRRNMMRWLLEAPAARERLPDWEHDTADIVARWRAMTARYRGDDRLRALVAELKRSSPEFARWWDMHDIQEHRSRLRRFRHPQHGEQTLRLIVVRAPDFAPCIVVFHVPIRTTEADEPPAG